MITGGTGFIGSHTVTLLLEKGFEVFLFDSFITSKESVITRIIDILRIKKLNVDKRLFLVRGDLRNKCDIEKVFNMALELGKPIDSVIHFGGLKSIKESISNPLDYWDVNVNGTLNLLKVMKENIKYLKYLIKT